MGDDFSEAVKRLLASRVGNLCSNPGCRALTSGPQDDPTKAVNVGVAAHITAASPGGPRYDPGLSPEERRAPSNGIWLCQNCAKLVDNDPAQFTVDLLKIWKQRAEVEARDRVGKTAASGSATYGTSEIDVSLKSELEHAGKITKYRIGIHNKSFRLIENLKVSIAEISPWPTDATYAAYNVHFPFRLWRGLGTESEGCRVNPDDTEWFDLLRWWISGSSEQQIIVGFGTQKIEGPSSYWEIKLEVTWAEGRSYPKVLATSTAGKLVVELANDTIATRK